MKEDPLEKKLNGYRHAYDQIHPDAALLERTKKAMLEAAAQNQDQTAGAAEQKQNQTTDASVQNRNQATEAAAPEQKTKPVLMLIRPAMLRRFALAAACLALFVVGAFMLKQVLPLGTGAVSETASTTAASLSENVQNGGVQENQAAAAYAAPAGGTESGTGGAAENAAADAFAAETTMAAEPPKSSGAAKSADASGSADASAPAAGSTTPKNTGSNAGSGSSSGSKTAGNKTANGSGSSQAGLSGNASAGSSSGSSTDSIQDDSSAADDNMNSAVIPGLGASNSLLTVTAVITEKTDAGTWTVSVDPQEGISISGTAQVDISAVDSTAAAALAVGDRIVITASEIDTETDPPVITAELILHE